MRLLRALLSLPCLLLTAPALAQQMPATVGDPADRAEAEPQPDRLRFLIRAGASFADLRGELTFERGPAAFEGDFGFAAGVGIELSLGDSLSLQPEVLIVRRFAALVFDGAGPGESSKLSTHYLTLPLYLKWYPGGRRGSRGNLTIGPVPGFLLGATRETRDNDTITEIPVDELVASLDWGVGIGGGFEFTEVFANFTVDARYVHGLTDMNEPRGVDTARWSTLHLTLGVSF